MAGRKKQSTEAAVREIRRSTERYGKLRNQPLVEAIVWVVNIGPPRNA